MPLVIILTAWVCAVGVCLRWQWRYENTAGPGLRTAAAASPSPSPPLVREGVVTVVMAVHPRCPCSKASVAALEELAGEDLGPLSMIVLATVPPEADEAWTKSDLCDRASRIPDVQFIVDQGGRLAARLGARTSGQVLVFDARARLVFAGGVTGSRGQTGPNAALASLRSLLTRLQDPAGAKSLAAIPGVIESPVFGCTLVLPDEEACATVP